MLFVTFLEAPGAQLAHFGAFSCSGTLSAVSAFDSGELSAAFHCLRVMEGSWRVVQLSPMWLACWPFCVLVEFVPSVISSRLMASCAALNIVAWHVTKNLIQNLGLVFVRFV